VIQLILRNFVMWFCCAVFRPGTMVVEGTTTVVVALPVSVAESPLPVAVRRCRPRLSTDLLRILRN
jgi:hypothetical protein